MEYGIYLHVPFCKQKCFYCDFPSFAGRERFTESYTEAVLKELSRRCGDLPKAKTIYIGGGTPTFLPPFLLEKIFSALARLKGQGTEFTLEANPNSFSEEIAALAARFGVNRVSLGAQTFDDERLKKIGRRHSAADIKKAVLIARKNGIENISLDLIYALPGQMLDDVKRDVNEALALKPKHISVYGLTIEEGTVFHRLNEEGKLNLTDEETQEAMYDWLVTELPARGYKRYEISNYALEGFESRHNLGYWTDIPYIGIGAAAHSYLDGRRTKNHTQIEEYIEAEKHGGYEEETEENTRENALAEFCFLALRTGRGVNLKSFREKFGCAIEEIYGEQINRLKKQGLLEETSERIFLTPLGMKLGNLAFAEFILD